tara:strand:- start:2010 stop:2750 length:741 start_codon:yes stop_codon:yes gene_type:complete
MTSLPTKQNKKLGLVIDLDICVGCHACAVNCKEWNTSGHSAPLHDIDPYGDDPTGVWFNRIHTFEVETEINGSKTVHFPKSCLHCNNAPCVTVCPTGASYKREEDGIVLVNPETCIGCKLCSWSCPYGAREYDEEAGIMKKCTLCVDKIYNENIPESDRVPACVSTCPAGARSFGDLGDESSDIFKLVEERDGYDLMPEQDCLPTNKYLPPREKNNQFKNDKLNSVINDNNFSFDSWKEIIEDASK